MNRTFCILATVAAMGLGTVSAAAASNSKPAKHPVQKKTHVVHHSGKTVHSAKPLHNSKTAAAKLHTSKPTASHKSVKPAGKSSKGLSHRTVSKSHAKGLSRLEKRRA